MERMIKEKAIKLGKDFLEAMEEARRLTNDPETIKELNKGIAKCNEILASLEKNF